ncbi:transcription termination/antitermination protein NusG [Treponema sp.]|uniref:transcription termination/antitermination protein NusG n=1 Tax=Treponema sp. TaxID=166 RepID=UPI003F00153D
MARNWYILQTYAGYEQKVQRTLNSMLGEQKLDPNIVFQIKVPMEEVVEISNGKKHVRNNLLLPGYIMVEMDLPQIGWNATCSTIRRVQGVTGFVGVKPVERPRPISVDEAKNILQMAGELKGEKQVRIKQNFEVGETVKITEGPFATFSGAIEAINTEKNKLRVNVQIFGRATPVEVDVLQVEKI